MGEVWLGHEFRPATKLGTGVILSEAKNFVLNRISNLRDSSSPSAALKIGAKSLVFSRGRKRTKRRDFHGFWLSQSDMRNSSE